MSLFNHDAPRLERFDKPLNTRLPRLHQSEGPYGDPIVRSLWAAACPRRELDERPSPDRLLANFLGNHFHSRFPLTREIAASLPPLGPKCRFSVCIPVAAHEEENYIRRALEAFRSQTMPQDTW